MPTEPQSARQVRARFAASVSRSSCRDRLSPEKGQNPLQFEQMRRAKGSRSYAWALLTHLAERPTYALSDEARQGLEYAAQLARDAPLRSRQALRNQPDLHPLTEAELAAEEGVTIAEIRDRVRRARRELFGRLTDGAISKRQQRERVWTARGKQPRPCAEAGCLEPLPAKARSNRRYCETHASPRARTRRHRSGIVAGRQPPSWQQHVG
jgi:hypothetical protein